MISTDRVQLERVAPPEPMVPVDQPRVSATERAARRAALRDAVAADWVVVYGDREHFANIAFLSGFDPRFEEALLVLGPDGTATLVVGNEGLDLARASSPDLDVVLCQSLSLLGQPRGEAPRLGDVLCGLGIREGASAAVVGWKYLDGAEREPAADAEPAFVPAFVLAGLRAAGAATLHDATELLLHPEHGLRLLNSADQIAEFEWAAARASAAVMRIVRSAVAGRTELELCGAMGYEGEPLSAHVMCTSGSGTIVGLRSPTARVVQRGDGVFTAVGYWGGLACRGGVLTADVDEAFFDAYVAPYYRAISSWYEIVHVGASGGEIWDAIEELFSGRGFRPSLNPGHAVSLDEWVHSPIRAGSTDVLASGAMLQCDIIPNRLPAGMALNCEDTVALAGRELQAELRQRHPELWSRIVARREFMRSSLGVALHDDVLPLSVAPAYLPPFWEACDLVCVRA